MIIVLQLWSLQPDWNLQVWNPPETESTSGFNYDNCEAARGVPKVMAGSMMYLVR